MTSMIDEIRGFARRCFADAPGSHDWTHTERVHRLCRQIGQCEGADLLVLDIAAYLHDIARGHEDESKGLVCHALKGSQMAAELLAKYPIGADRKTNIIHCVAAHRFRGNDAPETIEAKVLFDADKLDSIGAVGIGRAFLFAGEVGAKLHNPAIAPETTQAYSQEDTAYKCMGTSMISFVKGKTEISLRPHGDASGGPVVFVADAKDLFRSFTLGQR